MCPHTLTQMPPAVDEPSNKRTPGNLDLKLSQTCSFLNANTPKKPKITSLCSRIRSVETPCWFHTATFELWITKMKQTRSENGPVNKHLCICCAQEPVAQGILPLYCVTSSRNSDLRFLSVIGNRTRTSVTLHDANPSRGLNFETWLLATSRTSWTGRYCLLHLLLCRKRHFYIFAAALLFVISLDFAIAPWLWFGLVCVQPGPFCSCNGFNPAAP